MLPATFSLIPCSFNHEDISCVKPCTRTLQCGHPCNKLCYEDCTSSCDCKVEEATEDETLPGSASESELAGRSHINTSKLTEQQSARRKIKDPKDSGIAPHEHSTINQGHSDKGLAAKAQEESVEARQKRLDEENYAGLFGDTKAPVVKDRVDNVTLRHTKSDGAGGTRGVWRGTINVPIRQSSGDSHETSLLDQQ